VAEESDIKAESATRSGTTHSIRDIVERTFLAGMGAAALTKDRLQDLIDDLVRLGQLNAEEGREMVDRLLSRTREDARSVFKRMEMAAPNVYREQASAVQRQLEDQELRISQLEHRIQLLEGAADLQSGEQSAQH
jgi:polyhydroxyalkanoate synthesis regulator phasin